MSSPVNQSLLDVQALADERGVALQQAGISQVKVPLNLVQKNGQVQRIVTTVTLSVSLLPEQKGTHMSRFIEQLTEWGEKRDFSLNLHDFLMELKERLQAHDAHLTMVFPYFVEKQAPVSGLSAPMAYQCMFESTLSKSNAYQFVLGVDVPIATLCPCSKAISDYGAHNQRAIMRVRVNMDTRDDQPMMWIEDLIEQMEACASCPVFPMLKRPDEKWVTERQYDNPKFVEDVARDAILALRQAPGVKGFQVEVEALESIHDHNAWAFHQEGMA